jgi:cation transport ATPase
VTAAEASRWRPPWMRSPEIRLGIVTGAGLIAVMILALLAANRMAWLGHHAAARIWASYAAFALVMVLPVACFFRAPRRMFTCSMVGWVLFTLAYSIAGWFFFFNLFTRLNHDPFEVFVLGSFLYGIVAVGAWVCSLLADGRRHPEISRRPRHR